MQSEVKNTAALLPLFSVVISLLMLHKNCYVFSVWVYLLIAHALQNTSQSACGVNKKCVCGNKFDINIQMMPFPPNNFGCGFHQYFGDFEKKNSQYTWVSYIFGILCGYVSFLLFYYQ